MDSLRSLALDIDVPERTLRRAASEGLLHGERVSPRKFRTTLREQAYLREHWPLLSQLRGALRTEPSVRLALLYGSLAAGGATEHSDVDLLVVLDQDDVSRLAELSGRLTRAIGRDVQVVRLIDAQRSPALLLDVIVGGRVLVDRDRLWPTLEAREPTLRRKVRGERPLEDLVDDLAQQPRGS